MNGAWLGWALALAAVVVGGLQYGWQGLVLALSVIVFWLLLQFSRALRALRLAGQRPVGHVDSAVMLHAQLRRGMTLMQLIQRTRSLGERIGDGSDPERWRWADDGGAAVLAELRDGKLAQWTLERPPAQPGDSSACGSGAGSVSDAAASSR